MNRRILIAILLIGALARLAFCIVSGFNRLPVSDAAEYDLIAKNLVAGKGYRGISWGNPQEHPTAYRAPVFTWSLAALYRVFGPRYDTVRAMNIIAGVLTIYLCYLIGRDVFDRRVGLVAAGWLAIYPTAVFWTAELVAETQYLALQMLFLWLCLRQGWRRFILAGVCAGLCTLARPNFLLTLAMLPAWSLIVFWGNRRALAQAVALVLIAVSVVAPWTWRNYRVFGRFIPVTAQSGSNLLMGNNPVVVSVPLHYGKEVYEDRIPGFSEHLLGLPEAERDARAGEMAVAWLKANPDKWGFLVWQKFKAFCSPMLRGPDKTRKLIMLVSWGPVFLFAVPAFFVTLPARHSRLILHVMVLSTLAGVLIVFFNARYRFPSEPVFILFAAASVVRILEKIAPKSRLN